jgi:hypothetical protein
MSMVERLLINLFTMCFLSVVAVVDSTNEFLCQNSLLVRYVPGRYSNSLRSFILESSDGSNFYYILSMGGKLNSSELLLPVSGDWLGDGFDGVALYQQSTATFFLRWNTSVSDSDFDMQVEYGWPSSSLLPVTGVWRRGSTRSGLGLFDRSTGTFYLKYDVSAGPADMTFKFFPIEAASDPKVVIFVSNYLFIMLSKYAGSDRRRLEGMLFVLLVIRN